MVSLRKMAMVTLLVAAGSMVFGQGTTPPVTKSSDVNKDGHKVSFDLGWGSFGGDLDWDVMPAVTLGYTYGMMDNLGVGGQFNWSTYNPDEGDDFKVWTLDVFGAYTFTKDPNGMWGLAGFLELGWGNIDPGSGADSDSGLNYGLGVVFDYKLADQWKLAPYLKWNKTSTDTDFDAFTFGVNVLWGVQQGLNVTFGLAWEKQNVDIDLGSLGSVSADGSGFTLTVGVDYSFK